MARSPQLEALRAQVLARHKAATQKVSRLRRVNGVEIGGTEYDPRIEPAEIRKMTTRQAVRHLSRLEAFMSRGTAFVPGAENRPIPKSKWRDYKRAERINRQLGEAHFNRVKNVKLPNGQTIGEYEEQMSPKGFKRVGFTKGNRAYIAGERKSTGVRGVQGIDKLIDQMNKANRKNHPAKMAKLARSNMIATLEGAGVSPDIVRKAKRLTAHQIDVLWNYTKFARDASEKYWFTSQENIGGTVRPTTSHADMEASLDSQITWASQLQAESTEPQVAPRRRR